MNVTPHVAPEAKGSAIGARTQGHAGYALGQRIRKRICRLQSRPAATARSLKSAAGREGREIPPAKRSPQGGQF